MADSPVLSNAELQENSGEKTQEQKPLRDFCAESVALLYCRADSAKLCLNCDRQVHSTNQLFTKHTRSLLCDGCDSSPSSIFCSTHCSVLCQNCDWNRNSVCGQRKEDLLCQLREMANLEPNIDDDKKDLEPSSRLRSLVPEQNCQQLDTCTGFEHNADPIFFPACEAIAFQWCSDTGEDADQGLPTPSFESYFNPNCLVPDKESEIGRSLHIGNNDHEAQSHNPVITEASQSCHKVAPHELSSQGRDSAITQYKEKRKSRRYDRHIRYESCKVHAESRTRKGRFAKMDHYNSVC